MFGYRIVREEYITHLEIDNQAKAQMLRDYAEVIDGLRRHLDRYVQREKERMAAQIARNEADDKRIPAQAIPMLGHHHNW